LGKGREEEVEMGNRGTQGSLVRSIAGPPYVGRPRTVLVDLRPDIETDIEGGPLFCR